MIAGLIRPQARAALWRWREVAAAGGLGGLGVWLMGLGGLFLLPVGIGVSALALGWGVIALRRMRFAQSGLAPGVVEVLEGQVSYFGPAFGGSVSLPEVVELRLLTSGARRMWRLRQADAQVLLIPVEAVGAEALFDAFSGLPGLDTQALVAALNGANSGADTAAKNAGHAAFGATAAAGAVPLFGPRAGQPRIGGRTDSHVIWRRAARVVLT